jgi:beta-N-acetylhexosaminidase
MNKIRNFFFLVLIFSLGSFIKAPAGGEPAFISKNSKWVDSVFNTLSPDERIGQLFMVAAYSNRDSNHVNDIIKLVDEYKIGGLIFFQGGPVRQAQLTNYYQWCAKVPLLISIDGEWGLAMRLDSTVQYPRQMTLGAIQDDSLIYQMGKEIARECKRMGIHVNLAPVADINNNPFNPVISARSFGENKYNVTRKALMYMKGMQDAGIMANAKHFPGHGDTDMDSHKALPTIPYSLQRLDTLELFPFKEMIKQGLGSMMVAHLNIPAYDSVGIASTLSKPIVTDLLKTRLQFKGLIFTDALNMKGVSQYFKPGVVDVMALLAGNDVLLFSEDVPTAICEIQYAIEQGLITQEEIDRRCKKVLAAKKWVGLDKYKPVKIEHLYEDLNNVNAELINRKLAESSITLISNKKDILPLQRLDTLKIASLSLGSKRENTFQRMLGNYAPITNYNLDRDSPQNEIDSVILSLGNYNLVIVSLTNGNNNPKKDFGLAPQYIHIIDTLRNCSKVVVDVFANPYILSKIPILDSCDAVIMSYEELTQLQSLSAQAIFGGVNFNGTLPVTASDQFKIGSGYTTKKLFRFKYAIPEELGIDRNKLQIIDSLAVAGIKEKAYPGCQVLVAKNNKIIYQKSFGFHTYENKIKVDNNDLYDIASITKIAASTAAIMKLVDTKKIKLDDSLSKYLPELKKTNKQGIIIREMLAHQSGLVSWVPFWENTMSKGDYKKGIYSREQNSDYPYRVAEDLYIHRSYKDSIYKAVIATKVNPKKEYLYSDLGYYFIQRLIEKITKKTLDEYVMENFYSPLGLTTMGFKPRDRFPLERIVPTEYDVKFRKQLVIGDVHDPGAAMLGGVSGHAGLFCNAKDLAVIMQMYLQKGEYGGQRLIDSTTVKDFTRCQYVKISRRGAGFDKPEPDKKKPSPVCGEASILSFGHQGFTGTIAWADPETQMVYIFLSNRVYPDAEDNKLVKLGIRGSIQEAIYKAMKN